MIWRSFSHTSRDPLPISPSDKFKARLGQVYLEVVSLCASLSLPVFVQIDNSGLGEEDFSKTLRFPNPQVKIF